MNKETKNNIEMDIPIQMGTGYYKSLGLTREEANYMSKRSLSISVQRLNGGQTLHQIREGIMTERQNRLALAEQTWVKDIKAYE